MKVALKITQRTTALVFTLIHIFLRFLKSRKSTCAHALAVRLEGSLAKRMIDKNLSETAERKQIFSYYLLIYCLLHL